MHTLEFTADYGEYHHLLRFGSESIITDELKNALTSSEFKGLNFELYANVIRTYLEDTTQQALISFSGDYWKFSANSFCLQAN